MKTTNQEPSLEQRLVVRQEWIESERGWGIRPDGCSLHLSIEDCRVFIENYWKGMPKEVPDEYSRPEGKPKPYSIPEATYKKLEKNKQEGGNGVWA